MRAGWAIGAGVLAAALIMAGPASAVPVVAEPAALPTIVRAEDPVTFGSSHIVDKVGALGNRESEVTASLDRLFADTGTDLFVVYVANFTGAADRQAWTDQTAARNGMGATDVLLAVATADRQYQISVAPEFTLTDAQLSEVESVAIEPALHENDWAGAAIGAADGLRASLRGEAVVAPDITPGNAYPGGGGGATVWIVLIVIAGIGAILFLVLRRRRRPGIPAGTTPEALPAVPTPKLKQQASSALVQTDDAIKTSEQELGFAIAQYGADATGAFQTALDAAKAQLSQGFTLQQRLDDAEPDSEQQQRAWYAEIITLCQKANQALDEQAADFDELRQLEKKAPEAAASLARDIEAARARLTATQASLATLGEGYTQAAIATVADNPRQAEDRITFASASLAAANERIAAGEPSAAAVGIRAAEDSVDQAKLLLDAVDRLGADLQAAAGSVTKVVADLETDLVTARALPDEGAASASLPGVIANTEQTLADVKARLAAGRINPIELVQGLEAANQRMDAALQGVRDAEAQAQRAQAALNQTMLAARSQVSAAEDFITARRGAVGAEARTRLAEAGRLLAQAEALAAADPASALAAAQRASSLAAEAISLARNDVSGFGGEGGPGGMFGGGSRGGSDMGAVLGGILIGSILGGGRGGGFGGFGGGGRRGGGGSFGGGGFGIPGSFGGAGTRSRRGGGGRF